MWFATLLQAPSAIDKASHDGSVALKPFLVLVPRLGVGNSYIILECSWLSVERCLMDEAFENVKGQIGFCGIWCGSCVVGNGTLRELTKRYEKIIRDHGLEGWGAGGFDFKEFGKGLASIGNLPLCPGCRKGGGRDNCEMKACVSDKGIDDCSQCAQPEACGHRGTLEMMRSGALRAGLMVKTEDVDRRELLERWAAELKGKWPCSILFQHGR